MIPTRSLLTIVTTVATAALVALGGSPASAIPAQFIAGVGCSGGSPGPHPFQTSQDSIPVSIACHDGVEGIFNTSVNASSSVGPGFFRLQADANVGAFGIQSGSSSVGAQGFGEWFYDDFLIVGTGSDTTPILGALNLQISGTPLTFVDSDREGPLTSTGTGNAQFYFQIELDGMDAGYGEIIRRDLNDVINETVDGLLVGYYDGGDQFVDAITPSQLTLLPVGEQFRVYVYANAGCGAFGGASGLPADEFDTTSVLSICVSDFSATVQFPTTGPVFILPDGYTVYSESAGIVDNRVVVSQAVPEPSTLLLLGAGVLALLGWRVTARRQTRRWIGTA